MRPEPIQRAEAGHAVEGREGGERVACRRPRAAKPCRTLSERPAAASTNGGVRRRSHRSLIR